MTSSLVLKHIPYCHWEYTNPSTNDKLRIVPERGGLITEWLCSGREMLYFDRERFLDKTKSVRGGIPILFPICGKLTGDLLSLPQGKFNLNQHGFARDLPWNLSLLEDKSGIKLILKETKISYKHYPFLFDLTLEARVLARALEIKIFICNTGNFRMPYSFGLHPYFKISDLKNIRIDGLSTDCFDHIKSINCETCNQLAKISEGVDFLSFSNRSITLRDEFDGEKIQLTQYEPMDLTVVWTQPDREMVCLEPWTSPRGSLMTGERALWLDPGKSIELKCHFEKL